MENFSISREPVDAVVKGNATGEMVLGGAGRDDLQGNGGNDMLAGGSGADKPPGGTGDDFIDGGEGRDTIDARATEGLVVCLALYDRETGALSYDADGSGRIESVHSRSSTTTTRSR